MLFALALHDVDRVAQHTGGERDVGRGGDDGRARIMRGDDGHRSEVVEVTVCEHDQVERDIFDRLEVG